MRLKRVLKWTAIVSSILIVVLLIGAVTLVFMLPGIVQDQIDDQLATMGLGGSVRVSRVGLNSAALTNLQIGNDEHLSIDSAEVSYDIGELRAGRIRTLTLSGVRMLIKVDDEGNVDIGALSRVEGGASTEPTQLPFDRIQLRSSEILVRTPVRNLRIPISGTIETTATGSFKFDLASFVFGRDAALSGRCILGDASVVLEKLSVTTDGADLTVPGTDIVLGGAKIDLRGDGKLSSAEVSINIQPGSVVDIRTAHAPLHGVRIQPTTAGQRWLMATVGDQPIRVTNAGGDWTVAAKNLGVTMNATTLSLPESGVALNGLRGKLTLDVNVGPTGTDIVAARDSTVAVADAHLPIEAMRIDPTARPRNTDWVKVKFVEPLRVTIPKSDGGDGWAVRIPAADVTLNRTSITLADAGLDLRGVHGTLPMTANIDSTTTGLRINPGGLLSVADAQLPLRAAYIGPTSRPTVDDWIKLRVTDPLSIDVPHDDADGWTIDVPTAAVTVDQTSITFPEIGLDLRGVHGTLPMSAKINSVTTALHINPGGSLAIMEAPRLPGGISTRTTSNPNDGAPDAAPWGVVSLPKQRGSLTLGSTLGWDLSLPDVRAKIHRSHASYDRGAAVASAFEATARITLLTNPKATSIRLLEPITAGAHKLTLPAFDGATVTPMTLRIAAADDAGDAAQLRVADGSTAIRVKAALTDRFEMQYGATHIDAAGLGATFDLTTADTSRYAIDLTLDGAKLTDASLGLKIADLSATLPIRSDPAVPIHADFGRVITGPIELAGETLPSLDASATVIENRLRFNTTWQVLDTVPAYITGQIDSRGVQVEASIPPTEISDRAAVGRRFKALRGMEVTGRVGADATISYMDGKLRPHIRATLADVTFTEKTTKATASGINGNVTFDGLSPLTTPPTQRLKIASFRLGEDVEFTEGDLAFRINSGTDLFIERVRARFSGKGWWTAHAIRYNHDTPTVATEFYVEEMNLGDWLSVLTGEAVNGTGELYGRIPIVFRPNEGRKVLFGNGFLYAKSGKGTLTFKDAAMVGQLLESADPRFASDETFARVKDRVVEALADFEYSMFRFDLVEKDGDVTLRMETRGEGRTGQKQEVGSFVVNWNNFERNVNTYLFRAVPPDRDSDRAERSLDRFFAPIER